MSVTAGRHMRILALVLALWWSVCLAEGPAPILVVIERGPWRMLIGGESPTFALYDDGTILYLPTNWSRDVPFRTRRVADARGLRDRLVVFRPDDVLPADKAYSVTEYVMHKPTTEIWTPTGTIEVVGNWREPPVVTHQPLEPGTGLPRELLIWKSLRPRVRATLIEVDKQRGLPGAPWPPTQIEVVFWSYENAPERSIVWPKAWPGLGPRASAELGDVHRVFLPSKELRRLRVLFSRVKPRGAILISGRKMTASYRFPFPGESAWKHR